MAAFHQALQRPGSNAPDKMDQIQFIFSDPTVEPKRKTRYQERKRRLESAAEVALMYYIEMHGHMVSRTTDDYREMAMAGCVAVANRRSGQAGIAQSADSFDDYFRQLTEFEPKRAAQFRFST